MTEQTLSVKLEAIDVGLGKALEDLRKRFTATEQTMKQFSASAATAGKSFDSLRAKFTDIGQGTFEVGDRLGDLRQQFQQVGPPIKDASKGIDNYTDSMRKSEAQGRRFIKSISGVYATFVLAPRVTQQFGDALKSAAERKDVIKSFEKLADSIGVNADKLLESMQDAARGTVTEIELMRQANRAFLAGGAEFAQAIPQLFEIARATAAATGQEVTFVLDSLTKGIAKASVKLIDNAEVYIKVGDAVEEYAARLGKTADELDETTRRQAILAAVLEQGRGIVEEMGGEVDLATDAFTRYETAVQDAKQATLEFIIDAVGAESVGKLKAFSDVAVDLSGALQTLALLAIASGKTLPAFLGALSTALGRVSIAVLVLKEGLPALWKLLQQIDNTLPDLSDVWNDWTSAVEYTRIAIFDGLDAAYEWDQEQQRLAGTLRDQTFYTEQATEAFDKYFDTIGRGESAYEEYSRLVDLAQVAASVFGVELDKLTYQEFLFQQAVERGQGSLELQLRLLRDLQDALGPLSAIVKLNGETVDDFVARLEGLQEAERAAQAIEDYNKRMERAADLKPAFERALNDLQRLLERRRDLVADFNDDLEEEMRDHNRRMEDLLRDAARDRADALRDYAIDVRGAETDYQRDVEDAYRQHRFRLEDIERTYQRRMLEIREQYQQTVSKAARRRDVLAIINAREQRQIQERDARRDRDEQLYDENRNYQEQLRQAREAYEDRLQELKDALAEELRQINENLQRRQDDEERDFQEQLRKLAERHRKKMEDLEADLEEENNLIKRKRNEIQGWLNAHPIEVPIRYHKYGEPYTPMQHGFSGVVQGPQTFRVEPGVTEYVYASGDFKGSRGTAIQREALAPSQAATSAMALSHSIRGGISVGMSGLSSQLLNGVGPALQDSIGQAVVDAITAGILSSL